MSYKLETSYNTPSTAYSRGRQAKLTEIVIHHYGEDSATYESSRAWLTRPEASTSAHYIVDAGRVACIVDPDDTAWHAGSWPVNSRSVGIENHPIWTPARERTLVELCADLHEVYGNLTYTVHQAHSLTACPGRWAARVPHIIAAVNAELSRRKRPTVKVAGVLKGLAAYVHRPGVKAFHVVRSGDTLGEIARHYGVKIATLQKWNGITNPNRIDAGDRLRVR